EFGISRKTGYKIFDRCKDCGVQAFTDRSRRPYRQANRPDRTRVCGDGGNERRCPIISSCYDQKLICVLNLTTRPGIITCGTRHAAPLVAPTVAPYVLLCTRIVLLLKTL